MVRGTRMEACKIAITERRRLRTRRVTQTILLKINLVCVVLRSVCVVCVPWVGFHVHKRTNQAIRKQEGLLSEKVSTYFFCFRIFYYFCFRYKEIFPLIQARNITNLLIENLL